ncbi:MAG: serine/threonine protein kinase [Planctomycetota bacterium]|nr:serine/threonine protein kinase [Planctomycetota bacterium]
MSVPGSAPTGGLKDGADGLAPTQLKPAEPAGLAAPGTGGIPPPSRTPAAAQGLDEDALLRDVPRTTWEGRSVPALGGIPLLAKLGQGGMGAVYYGLHPRLGYEVAVKILPAQWASRDPELLERFKREAHAAVRIKSPRLVGVLDINEERGLAYMVMEFVAGASAGTLLREIRQSGGAGLSEAAALEICLAACEGLAAAHAAGVIHRDVKPDNILVPWAKDGKTPAFAESKLADLGLARREDSGASLTASNEPMGTPGYMSPEQATDARSARKPADVFSMGAALYALLAGQAPFKADTPMNAMLMAIHRAPVPLRHMRPDIGAATEHLIERCLAKNPAERYPDGAALCEALKVCLNALGRSGAQQADALTALARIQQTPETGTPVAPNSGPVAAPARGPSSTPAPAVTPVVAAAAPVPRRTACSMHPDADAAFICHRCGKAHCPACRRVLANGREVCPGCAGQGQSVQTGFCDRCRTQSSERTPGSISTVNGVGRKFYGSAEPCPDCASVIRTLWFTFIDFPLIPLGSYRYKPLGEEGMRSSQFLARRTPLRWEQVFATWFVGVLVGGAILAAVFIYNTYYKAR